MVKMEMDAECLLLTRCDADIRCVHLYDKLSPRTMAILSLTCHAFYDEIKPASMIKNRLVSYFVDTYHWKKVVNVDTTARSFFVPTDTHMESFGYFPFTIHLKIHGEEAIAFDFYVKISDTVAAVFTGNKRMYVEDSELRDIIHWFIGKCIKAFIDNERCNLNYYTDELGFHQNHWLYFFVT